MLRHDTSARSMTRHDASESRCVMPQVPVDGRVPFRMTHMTRFRLPSRSACVRTRTRTRMQKSCFPVSYASCVMDGRRPATLPHVAAGERGATTVPPLGRTPLTPTWAATAGRGGRDRRGVRYFPARIGPRSRREHLQFPTEFVARGRSAGLTARAHDSGMKPTPRESAAALRLAESLIEFVLAVEEGVATRRAARPREELRVRVDAASLPQREPDRPAPPPAPDLRLLKPREAAQRLGIGARLLWSMSAPNGPIPTVRIGRRVLYSPVDLDQVIERLRTKPRSPRFERHP